jgi:hypothetical protein
VTVTNDYNYKVYPARLLHFFHITFFCTFSFIFYIISIFNLFSAFLYCLFELHSQGFLEMRIF